MHLAACINAKHHRRPACHSSRADSDMLIARVHSVQYRTVLFKDTGRGRTRTGRHTQNADRGRATPHSGTNPHTGQYCRYCTCTTTVEAIEKRRNICMYVTPYLAKTMQTSARICSRRGDPRRRVEKCLGCVTHRGLP